MIMTSKVHFEVFGKVQGVFFRRDTQAAAKRLGVTGWVRNTPDGTVEGEAFGDAASVDQFKKWVSTEGSKKSRIDRCEFSDNIVDGTHSASFDVVR
ncbi:Acylphosphatase [Plasmodiophora brassicae]